MNTIDSMIMGSLDSDRQKILNRLRTIAVAMDAKYSIGKIKIGWDGILGLIPGFGELITTLTSLYIILAGSQLGLPTSVITRLALNVVLDNLLSSVPFLGWIFDFFYRSNLKNLKLIESYVEQPGKTARRSSTVLGLVLCLVLGLSFAIAYGIFVLMSGIYHLIFQYVFHN